MAGKEVDPISAKADNIVGMLDKGDSLKALQAMQDELQCMTPASANRLFKAIDQKDNKKLGDNLEIVDTRHDKVIILTGKNGEALVGSMKN